MMGASTLVPGLPICSVYPSGLERAISSIARMPKAPGLFSITTGWPRIGRICSPTMRMTISVALPGPNGTTTLTGFEGYLSCAATWTPPRAKTSTNKMPNRFMSLSASGDASTASDRPLQRSLPRWPRVIRASAFTSSSPQRRHRRTLVGQFDLDLGDGLSPRRKFAVEPRLRLLQRRVRLDADELLLEGFLQLRGIRGLDDRLEEGCQNLFGRTGRCQHALPVQSAHAGVAGLGQRWDIGIFRQPCLRQHRDRPQLAGLDHRCRARGIDERDLRVADDEIVDHAGGAGLVGDVEHLDAGALGKDLDVVMGEAADAGTGVADLAGILLRIRDQLRHRLRLEILRGGEQEGRIDREPRNRHHVLLEVDGELLREQDRCDGIGRDVAHHQRVAVRLGASHLFDGENAERARLALDHELLAEALAHLLTEQARGDVGGAAGSIRYDDLDRARGIFVLRRGRDAAERKTQQRQTQTDPFHHVLPVNPLKSPPRRVSACQ